MPSRLLRDWTDSQAVDGAKEEGESLFVRLLMKADDFSHFVADPVLVKSACYPRRNDLTSSDVVRRLVACQAVGLIACYATTASGASRWLSSDELAGPCKPGEKWHLLIPKFGQRLRPDAKPKYPEHPPNPPNPAAGCGGIPLQSESYSKPKAQSSVAVGTPTTDAATQGMRDVIAGIECPEIVGVTQQNQIKSLVERFGVDATVAACREAILRCEKKPRFPWYAEKILVEHAQKKDKSKPTNKPPGRKVRDDV